MKYMPLMVFALMISFIHTACADSHRTVVLELFTSQGCSSCPPADVLLRRLSNEDPTLLPLSFHVDYWDHLGWKDPFSSKANTERQNNYEAALGERQMFTPQLIIDGTHSVIGSEESSVRDMIAHAKAAVQQTKLQFLPLQDTRYVSVVVTPSVHLSAGADVWSVRYNRLASTAVSAGENSGRKLENVNNVIGFERLGTLQNDVVRFTIAKPKGPHEGVAIIVQQIHQGSVLGAGFYQEPALSP